MPRHQGVVVECKSSLSALQQILDSKEGEKQPWIGDVIGRFHHHSGLYMEHLGSTSI